MADNTPRYLEELPRMIAAAEERFGRAMSLWKFGTIGYDDDGPHCWYRQGEEKIVDIELSPECRAEQSEIERGMYQLSHESVHLLCANGKQEASILEEGLATIFSIEYMRDRFGSVWGPSSSTRGQKYSHAMSMTRTILDTDPYVIAKIRREFDVSFKQILPRHLVSFLPDLDPEVAEKLTTSFY